MLWAMAGKKRKKVTEEKITGLKYFDRLMPLTDLAVSCLATLRRSLLRGPLPSLQPSPLEPNPVRQRHCCGMTGHAAVTVLPRRG